METSFTSDVRQIKYATGYEFGYTRALRLFMLPPARLFARVGQKAYNAREGIETKILHKFIVASSTGSESIQCSRGH